MHVLSLILPTYNEAANIPSLLDLLDGVLHDLSHEIIIVDDDSPDGTWKVAQRLTTRFPALRVLRRSDKKGLSSAVIDGFDAAHGDVLAVMDADGQHDATYLRSLEAAVRAGADLSLGSRYMEGGSVGDWIADRRIISKLGTFFAAKLSAVPVTDPLSGCFAIRTPLYRQVRAALKPTGFKILLELLANIPPTSRVIEVPLIFRPRLHGQSKLSLQVHISFLWQVLRLTMVRLQRHVRLIGLIVFWLASFLTAAAVLPRAYALRDLRDARLRGTVQHFLNDVADENGWLLSDIDLRTVGSDQVTFVHRVRVRSFSSATHCLLRLTDPPLTTCDD
jgi:glycosyltransferase involved in cell wall biosynthesis